MKIKIENESRRAPPMKATGKYWPTKLYSTKFSSRGAIMRVQDFRESVSLCILMMEQWDGKRLLLRNHS